MALMNDVYSYIESNYQPNEPIFLSELSIPGIHDAIEAGFNKSM